MPRISKTDYETKLENIRTALIRGFTDKEVCVAEKIAKRTLRSYKATIERRGLKLYPRIAQKAIPIFIKQIQRLEDVIRQVNRNIMANPHEKLAPKLRIIILATKEILGNLFRAGLIAEVPKEYRISGDMDISVMKETVKFIAVTIAKEDPELAERLEQVLINIPAK